MHLDTANIPKFEPKEISLPEEPLFISYKPDFEKIRSAWKEFGMFSNILVIGNGGSITSFMGMQYALGTQKNVFILNTPDPEYITILRRQLRKHDTLVIAISKSGETVSLLESLFHFIDYPLLFITEEGSTLHKIAEKKNARTIAHPPIGGRYVAFTEVALVPAAICGLKVEEMYKGARNFYSQYKSANLAMKAAQIFYALENMGYVDVFMPFYSHYLFGFSNLALQLCHESFGKGGKGQTYAAFEAPESQHHTNQRFFGGRKNMCGFFVLAENFREDQKTSVPASMHSLPLRDGSLFDLNKIPLSVAMRAEFGGTWENAKIENIPVVSLGLNSINPIEVGSFIAFWQLYAVYSSVLRDVNPFDQPEVENSKKISWLKRKDYFRGL